VTVIYYCKILIWVMLMLLLVHYMWMYIPALMIYIDPIDASHVFIIQLPIKALFIDFKMDFSINSYDNKKCESLIINEYGQHSWCDTFTTYNSMYSPQLDHISTLLMLSMNSSLNFQSKLFFQISKRMFLSEVIWVSSCDIKLDNIAGGLFVTW